MKISIVQFNPTVGDLSGNRDLILTKYREAEAAGADLVIVPEMSITGYPIEDLAKSRAFVVAAQASADALLASLRDGKAGIVFGALLDNGADRLPSNGAIVFDPQSDSDPVMVKKYELPNYGVFDEKRIFEGAKIEDIKHVVFRDKRLGVMICEDIWFPEVTRKLFSTGCDLFLSLNGSPYEIGKNAERIAVVKERLAETFSLYTVNIPFLYANMVGGQDELVFDGGSFVISQRGLDQFPFFQSGVYDVDLDLGHSNDWNLFQFEATGVEETYAACVTGLRDYVAKQKFETVVLGMSGGVDSGIVAAIAVDALGADKVDLVRLPSKFSSEGSLTDAETASDRLGTKMRTIPIEPVVDALRAAYAGAGYDWIVAKKDRPALTGVADENIQARARGNILMAISNNERHMLLTTGNKSEVSVGYCVDGSSLVSTDQGIFDAKALYGEGDITIQGNPIKGSQAVVKNEAIQIVSQFGNSLTCGVLHPFKVYEPDTGKFHFVSAEKLKAGDVVVGSQLNCRVEQSGEMAFRYVKALYDFKSPDDLDIPDFLDFDSARFIGICIADGSFGKGTYTITTTKDEVVEVCREFLTKCKVSHSVKCTDGIIRVVISSVEFVSWLSYCGVNHKSENKVIPIQVLRASSDSLVGFLAGVLLDSSLNAKKNTTEMLFNAKNPRLAEELHVIVGILGIRSYLRHGKHGRTSVYFPSSELGEIETLKSKNSSVMMMQDANRIKPKAGLDYIYYTKIEMMDMAESLPWRHRRTVHRADIRISRAWVLDRVKKGILDSKWLKAGTRFHEITAVESLTGHFVFYDFTVSGSEQFEANGFTVHNSTLYGDMAGGFNPIKDCYKTTVWEMCRYRNAMTKEEIAQRGYLGTEGEIIPEEIITKSPSAELRADQQDSDSLPPYDVLDGILKNMIEQEMSVADIISSGVDSDLVIKVRALLDRAEYKRRQAAPGVKVTSKLHGRERRFPIVNHFTGSERDD